MPPKKGAGVVPYDGPTEGQGAFHYDNGAVYVGEWRMLVPAADAPVNADGSPPKPVRVRHGTGRFTDGPYSYEGAFCDDCMDGHGRFHYASGAMYTGEWRNNQYHGKGKYVWPDGRSYEGDFVDNVFHGQGLYRDGQGRSWSGQFRQGSGPGLTFNLT